MNEIEEEKEKRKYSLVSLSIIIVFFIGFCATLHFVVFINHQSIQLEVKNHVYNGTHLSMTLALTTNSTIHPYGIKLYKVNGTSFGATETFGKKELSYSDSLTISLPITFGDIKHAFLSFFLLCDEGEFPFEVEVSLNR